jgi:hypothetical protein
MSRADRDAEALDVDPDRRLLTGEGEALQVAFGATPAEAWVRLVLAGARPQRMMGWGLAEAETAFALGAGLPWLELAAEGRGALAVGCVAHAPERLVPLREPGGDGLALGARLRALIQEGAPFAPRLRAAGWELAPEPPEAIAEDASGGGDPVPPVESLPGDLSADRLEGVFRTLVLSLPEAADPDWIDLGPGGLLAVRAGQASSAHALDPFWGAATAVAEAGVALAGTGAEGLGLAVALPLVVAESTLLGLRQAAASLDLPVIQVQRIPGLTSPLVLALGLADAGAQPVDVAAPEARGLAGTVPRRCGSAWRRAFDGCFVLGSPREELGGSRYLAWAGGSAPCPEPWLDELFRMQTCLREGVALGLLRSVAPLGAGGLMGALHGAHRATGFGAQIFLEPRGGRLDALAFGATPGRALVTVSGEGESALRTLARTHRLPLTKVGVVGGGRFTVVVAGEPAFDLDPPPAAEERA